MLHGSAGRESRRVGFGGDHELLEAAGKSYAKKEHHLRFEED